MQVNFLCYVFIMNLYELFLPLVRIVSNKSYFFSVGTSWMSTVSIRGYNDVNSYVYTDRSRHVYRGVSAAGGIGETNGCVTSTADRVQSLHRSFHGLIFSPESSLANRFLISCLSMRIPESLAWREIEPLKHLT